MATNEVKGAMFDDFSTGGLIDDADVTLSLNRFVRWDYNGTQPNAVLALNVKMTDDEAQVHDQYLSAGDLRFFVPSDDGKKAVPVGSQTRLNLNTNAVQFIISIMNADTRGELAAKLRSSDDISVLDGLRCHIVRKAQPKRAGIIVQPGTDGQQREKTVLTVEKILSYPWEAAAVAAKPAAATATQRVAPATATATAAAPTQAAAPAAAGDIDSKAVGVLLNVLLENGGAITKTAIAGKVFSNEGMKAETAPVRNAILGLIVRPDFLGAAGRPWTYDAATGAVSLG